MTEFTWVTWVCIGLYAVAVAAEFIMITQRRHDIARYLNYVVSAAAGGLLGNRLFARDWILAGAALLAFVASFIVLTANERSRVRPLRGE